MMDGAAALGANALLNICLSLVCIIFSLRVLRNIQFEKWLRVKTPEQARFLLVLLSIALGHQLATFFIDYLGWFRLAGQLFV
jgi:uncharacterized integral membrane protein (TIGR02327 family)